jgi:hypothetical protein
MAMFFLKLLQLSNRQRQNCGQGSAYTALSMSTSGPERLHQIRGSCPKLLLWTDSIRALSSLLRSSPLKCSISYPPLLILVHRQPDPCHYMRLVGFSRRFTDSRSIAICFGIRHFLTSANRGIYSFSNSLTGRMTSWHVFMTIFSDFGVQV